MIYISKQSSYLRYSLNKWTITFHRFHTINKSIYDYTSNRLLPPLLLKIHMSRKHFYIALLYARSFIAEIILVVLLLLFYCIKTFLFRLLSIWHHLSYYRNTTLKILYYRPVNVCRPFECYDRVLLNPIKTQSQRRFRTIFRKIKLTHKQRVPYRNSQQFNTRCGLVT